MKLFEKEKFASHQELDKEWGKLNREYKTYAIRYAKSEMLKTKEREELRAQQKEAEKGKKVGKECTCLPKYKNCNYVDFLCSYCRNRHYEDWVNSPG